MDAHPEDSQTLKSEGSIPHVKVRCAVAWGTWISLVRFRAAVYGLPWRGEPIMPSSSGDDFDGAVGYATNRNSPQSRKHRLRPSHAPLSGEHQRHERQACSEHYSDAPRSSIPAVPATTSPELWIQRRLLQLRA